MRILDSKKRSIVKALTSKLLEISISAGALQVIFEQPFISLGLPSLLEGLQMIGYYLHERIWSKVSWGNGCENCKWVNFADLSNDKTGEILKGVIEEAKEYANRHREWVAIYLAEKEIEIRPQEV